MSEQNVSVEVIEEKEVDFISPYLGGDESIDESESVEPSIEIKKESGKNKEAADKQAADKQAAEDTVDSEEKNEKKTGDVVEKPEKGTPPGVKKRIDKVIRQREDEKRAHAATKVRLAELEAAQAAKPAETPAEDKAGETEEDKAPELPEKPKATDFDDYDEYLEAHDKYTEAKQEATIKKITADLEKKFAEKGKKDDEAMKQATAQEEENAAYNEKLDRGRKKYPDFDEIAMADTVPYNDDMIKAVVASENTDELAYYLGQNITEADRIATIKNPSLVALEVGKLDALLTAGVINIETGNADDDDNAGADTDKTNNKISNAPPPPTTVGRKGVSTKDESKMSTEEFIKSRNKRDGLIR